TRRRDRQIAIEACTDVTGPSQFPVEQWVPLVPLLWAARDTTSGDETFSAQQVSGVTYVKWSIPYRSDCDPETGVDVVKRRRVIAEGRVYDIVGAQQYGKREGLELLTRAKVG